MNKSVKFNPDWKFKESFPSISAYTTTYNALIAGYPLEQSISSFSWCDEIVVVDGGSTDGTMELLRSLEQKFAGKMNIVELPIDLSLPTKDGYQKSLSRAMCSSRFCLQFDADEICLGSVEKWKRLAKDFPDQEVMMNLVVLEPFGSISSLRLNKEHTNWKWRLSRNLPEITHGLPRQDKFEHEGKIYSKGATDGTFPIHIVQEDMIQSWFHPSAKKAYELYAKDAYKEYVQQLLKDQTPLVLHLGHINLYKKTELYLNSWHYWWCLLYNKDPNDPKNNKYFPAMTPKQILDLDDEAQEVLLDNCVKKMREDTPVIKVEELEHGLSSV